VVIVSLVVSIRLPETLVSEMTCYLSSGKLNFTYWLTNCHHCLWNSGQGDYVDPSSNVDSHSYSELQNIPPGTDTVTPSGKTYANLLMTYMSPLQCVIK